MTKLDESESDTHYILDEIVDSLKILYEEKEELETKHTNNSQDKVVAENDLERLAHLSNNNIQKALEIARKRFKKKTIRWEGNSG